MDNVCIVLQIKTEMHAKLIHEYIYILYSTHKKILLELQSVFLQNKKSVTLYSLFDGLAINFEACFKWASDDYLNL